MTLETLSKYKCFGGFQQQYSHFSEALQCKMRFSIFLPPQCAHHKVPVLYWLSGLTCTDENFTQKAGAQRIAAELGIAIVAPDTSPRGPDVKDDDSYDLGQGAGFYLNATQDPWLQNYRMYAYIVDELPQLIETEFPVSQKRSISGHSMGGHGALVISLRNPEQYLSVSAFSPISNPMKAPWGQKAFTAYFGTDQHKWREYDASILMSETTQHLPTLVDQGEADNFLDEQLMPDTLESAAATNNYPLNLRRHPGYDHSYFFIASFIEDHLRFHHQYLTGKTQLN